VRGREFLTFRRLTRDFSNFPLTKRESQLRPSATASDMIATQPIAASQRHQHAAWGFRNCTVFSLNSAAFS